MKQIRFESSGEMHRNIEDAVTQAKLAHHAGMHTHYRDRLEEIYEELAAGRQVDLCSTTNAPRIRIARVDNK